MIEKLETDSKPDPLARDMALRDYFAGLAMQGILHADTEYLMADKQIAELAYAQADAMLEVRNGNT